jgi:GT2 family glycosyltransferase
MSRAEVVGPRLVTTEKLTTQWWDHGELYGFRAWIAQNAGHAFWKEQKNITRVAWVSGAVFLIEKAWFDRIGGFDENFFLYMEELDLCFRLRELDGRVVYDPTIVMFHHSGVVAKKSEYQQISGAYFIKKHFRSRPGYYFLQLINRILN